MPCKSEIEQFDLWFHAGRIANAGTRHCLALIKAAGQHDVRGFHVPVNDRTFMGADQRAGNIGHDLEGQPLIERPALQQRRFRSVPETYSMTR